MTNKILNGGYIPTHNLGPCSNLFTFILNRIVYVADVREYACLKCRNVSFRPQRFPEHRRAEIKVQNVG